MQITDDIILKYSGSLLEIYTVNTDSFSVGSIALYSNSEILFRIYDELGREVALYLVKREHINNIIANTEYLKKMDLYCEYWKGENINKSTYFLEYMSNLCKDETDIISSVIDFVMKKMECITIQTYSSEMIDTGFISDCTDGYVTLRCIDIETAKEFSTCDISISDIWFLEFCILDNTLLSYAFNKI